MLEPPAPDDGAVLCVFCADDPDVEDCCGCDLVCCDCAAPDGAVADGVADLSWDGEDC